MGSIRHPLPVATSARLLTGLLTVTGTLHFVVPKPFVAVVPPSLPQPELLVALSGVAELVCAVLLAPSRTRKLGGLAAAATFVAVYPANISMALRAHRRTGWYRLAVWLRLPLQIPLITEALRVARG